MPSSKGRLSSSLPFPPAPLLASPPAIKRSDYHTTRSDSAALPHVSVGPVTHDGRGSQHTIPYRPGLPSGKPHCGGGLSGEKNTPQTVVIHYTPLLYCLPRDCHSPLRFIDLIGPLNATNCTTVWTDTTQLLLFVQYNATRFIHSF